MTNLRNNVCMAVSQLRYKCAWDVSGYCVSSYWAMLKNLTLPDTANETSKVSSKEDTKI